MGILPLLKGSSIRKSEANVQPGSTGKLTAKGAATDQKQPKMSWEHCCCGICNELANPPSAGLIEKGQFSIKSLSG